MVVIYHPIVKLVDATSGQTFTASNEAGNSIDYAPNGPQTAQLIFDNSLADFTFSDIAPEDDVTVKVNDGSTDYTMLTGYITKIDRVYTEDDHKIVKVLVVDYGAYLAGKTIGEPEGHKSTTANALFTTAAGYISGVTTNIDSNSTAIKKEFTGTLVKDLLKTASQVGGMDWFFDESKVLQAFNHNGRAQQISSHNIKIKDSPASNAWEFMVHRRDPYSFSLDSTLRYRSLTATNGIAFTYPPLSQLHLFTTKTYWDDKIGQSFGNYMNTANFSNFDVNTHAGITVQPHSVNNFQVTSETSMPAMSLYPASTGHDMTIYLEPFDGITTSPAAMDLGIPLDTFTEFRFFMKNSLATATMTDLELRLGDTAYTTNYWAWKIKHSGGSYLGGSSVSAYNALNTTNWTYIRVFLPTSTSNSLQWNLSTTNWIKTGSPAAINTVQWIPTPTTGYTGSLDFAQIYFYGKRRKTVTGSGTPATANIITDRSIKDVTTLNNLATSEQARANQIANTSRATVFGNTIFTKPGYKIDIDFTNTLGSDASATGIRIASIHHELTPLWLTSLSFDRALPRV